ncbi:MAG TPA: TonB family protein [Bacteroidia bacterium]|jgi:TonB family protein|nr:TonB family protein [Bacteroidia bacterium]
MKGIAIIFIFICGSILVNAQCRTVNGDKRINSYGDTTWCQYTYCIITQDSIWNESPMSRAPEFMGDINKWFLDNLNYPSLALDGQLQGTVFLGFCVEKDGSVSNFKILHGAYNLLNDEALKVATKMPKWKPEIRNHHIVKTNMFLTVRFILKYAEWKYSFNTHKENIMGVDSVYLRCISVPH